jgi:hypothetical protein
MDAKLIEANRRIGELLAERSEQKEELVALRAKLAEAEKRINAMHEATGLKDAHNRPGVAVSSLRIRYERTKERLAEAVGALERMANPKGHTPQQACCNIGYCPELGYPLEDWCYPCQARAALPKVRGKYKDRLLTQQEKEYILDRIEDFRKECAEAEYTDTGDMWDLVRWIESVICLDRPEEDSGGT